MSGRLGDVTQDIDNIRNNARIYEEATDDYTLRKARSYLFFDDNTRIEYLASERFPNDNRAALKYTNIDGNLLVKMYFMAKNTPKNFQTMKL